MTATALDHAPVLASRRYIRDDRGRFAETPDGGVLDADLYQSTYGAPYDERTEDIGMVSVRVFEDGGAHLVVDHDEEDDGIERYEVLVEFDDSENMRAVAHALQRISMIDVPEDADHRDGLVDQEDLGNGWAVGVDASGTVGFYQVDDDGEIADGAVADMDPTEGYWLADAIFEMAEAVDDIIRDAEDADDDDEWESEEGEDDAPSMAARRTRRVPRGKYNPGQKRDGDGQWSDGIPDADVDLDDDYDNAALPAAYLDKYGQVVEETTVDLPGGGPKYAVAITDKRSLHVAQGHEDRTVRAELTPAQARSLADTLGDIYDDGSLGTVTDEASGVKVTRTGADYQLTWPDGVVTDLDESDREELSGLAEGLRDMAYAYEDRFGEHAKSLVGRPERPKLSTKVDKLRLNPRIELAAGEELRASRKLPSSEYAETQLLGAAVSTPDGPEVRVGIALLGDEQKWSADADGATLKLGPADIDRIAAAIDAEHTKGQARSAERRKLFAEHEKLQDARDSSEIDDTGLARLAELDAWYEHLEIDDVFSEGVIPAGPWGDLAFQVQGEEGPDVGWRFALAVKPTDADDTWEFPETWTEDDGPGLIGDLDATEMRKFVKQLGSLLATASPDPKYTATAGVRAELTAPVAATVPNAAREPGPATGAMIALVPADADAARLAVGGGEPADGLHLTLWYLGDAAAISEENRAALATAVRSMVERRELPPVEARVFGADLWNADSDKPAWVLGVGDLPPGERPPGQETLAVCKEMMSEAWHDGGIVIDVPPQHTPWQPHMCVAYSADPALLPELVDRLGPVTFDRIRVAFAGEAVDIPLIAPSKPTALPGEPALGPSNAAVAAVPANRKGRLLPIRAFTEPINHHRGGLVGARTEARAARTRMRVQAKRKWFRIEAKSSGTDIYLYGEVGYFGVTAADFCEELRRVKASTIRLHINSPGGQVHEGVAIYGALREHPATINVTVDGIAASAASFIACAGDRITIMRYAQMMIHDAWSDAYGNADQLRKQADLLERTSVTIADIYSQRAGGDAATWRALMKAETWFNAEEAVQFGLADDVGGDVLAPAAVPVKSAWDLSVFAFPGRDRAPAPALAVMAVAPEAEPAAADDDGAPAGDEPSADADAPAAEPDLPADTQPAPDAAQPTAWAAPAWTDPPADPWQSLVSGLTTPEPSTPDDPTAQEATK